MTRKRQRGTKTSEGGGRRDAAPLEAYLGWVSSLAEVLESQRPGVDVLLDRMVRRRILARELGRFGR